MPLYEYQCDACDHRFEVIQRYADAPIESCPKCANGVRKLLSSPAIQFKGSGWYITDYARAGKSDSGAAAAAKSENQTASSDSKGDSKSESKGETKTETTADSKSKSKGESKPSNPATS